MLSAQLAAIRRTRRKVSPRFGKVVVLRVLGSRGRGGGVDSVGQGEVEEPLPPGPVLSQRDQALVALKALVKVLEVEVGSGGGGLDVEEVIRQLRCLSEEDRERCMRTFAVLSDEGVLFA